ncbi:MAG TPA: cell division protein, partial [Gammaproteobacteria bacterium]|nr:cell division protein [Gammaproteobacteria bacterium]
MVIVFITMMVTLVYRAGYLAFLEREFLQDQGQLRTDRVEKIHTNRAVILDRNGEPLAVSTPVISIWFDPERDKISMDRLTELAEITGVSENLLNSRIENGENKRFVYLARRISPGKAKAVENMQIGVRYETEYRRFYPAGAFAAHVVGMTGIDDGGQEGIELAMDENLRGSPGSKRVQRDRLGNVIRDLDFYVAPEFGKDVRLSIDLRLQFQAYRELLSAVKYHQAISGS